MIYIESGKHGITAPNSNTIQPYPVASVPPCTPRNKPSARPAIVICPIDKACVALQRDTSTGAILACIFKISVALPLSSCFSLFLFLFLFDNASVKTSRRSRKKTRTAIPDESDEIHSRGPMPKQVEMHGRENLLKSLRGSAGGEEGGGP